MFMRAIRVIRVIIMFTRAIRVIMFIRAIRVIMSMRATRVYLMIVENHEIRRVCLTAQENQITNLGY
jgi:hypothetical protein